MGALDWLQQHIAQPVENDIQSAKNAVAPYISALPSAVNYANNNVTTQAQHVGNFLGGLVKNTGQDVLPILKGIGGLLAAVPGAAINSYDHVTGRPAPTGEVSGYLSRSADNVIPGIEGTVAGEVQGVKNLWNNPVQQLQTIGSNIYQHPLQTALNVAPITGATSKLIGGAADVARAGDVASETVPRPGLSPLQQVGQSATRTVQDFGDQEGIKNAVKTLNANIPEQEITVKGNPVSINGAPATEPVPTRTITLDEGNAMKALRKNYLNPNTVPLNNYSTDTLPKVKMAVDPTGKIVSWSPQNSQFAERLVNSPYAPNNQYARAINQGKVAQDFTGNPDDLNMSNVKFRSTPGSVNRPTAADIGRSNVPLQTELPPNEGTGSNIQENKFTRSAIDSPEVSSVARPQLQGSHIQRSNQELAAKAQNLVNTNENAARTLALQGGSDESVATAIQLARKYRAEGNYDEEAHILNETSKNAVEAGRTVQAHALLERLSPEGQARLAARSIQKYNEEHPNKPLPELTGGQVKEITEQAKIIETLPDGPEKSLTQQKLWEHIADLTPSSFSDRVLSIRRAGLLTAPTTYAKVVASHAAFSGGERLSNLIAGKVIDPAIALFSKQRGIMGGSEGYGTGLVQGAKDSVNHLVTGYDPNSSLESIKNNRINYGNSVVGKATQAYVEGVGRSHTVLPGAFKEAALQNSLHDQALTEAANRGLTGTERYRFVEDFKKNPTPQALEIARREADYETFNNKTALGEGISKVQQVKGLGPVAKFLVPFTRVPSAITAAVSDYSPIGALKGIYNAVKAGDFTPEVQRQLSKEIGRSIVGTAAIAFGYQLFKHGLITTKPKDQTEANLWAAQNKPWNSINIDGQWHSLGSFGPAGSELAIGAYYGGGLVDTKKTPGSVTQAAIQGAEGLGAIQLDQPYLQGASTITSALQNPTTAGQSAVNSAAGSFVPSISADLANATDTSKRIQTNSLDAIKYRIPGLRQGLPAQVDVLGNPKSNGSDGFLGKVIDPTATTAQATDPVSTELSRLHDNNLDATPAAVTKTLTTFGVSQTLTPQQISDYQKIVGSDINQGIGKLIQSSEYQGLDDSAKQAAIQKLDALVRQRDSINYAAKNNLPTTDQTPGNNSDKQGKESVKLQAANAYQNGDGASYYKLISTLPSNQQTTVANEIKEAFGDDVAGKSNDAAQQVITSLDPTKPTVLGSQAGALNYLNNFNSFQNKRSFELNGSDPQPIYQLPNNEASQALAVKAQLPGVQSNYIDAIKAQPWYKQYSAAQSAWYDRNPSDPDYVSPAGPSPVMSSDLSGYANQIAAVKAAGGKTGAYYNTPEGQQLTQFYNQLDQYQNKKLGLVNLPPAYVPSTQYPGELAAVGSAGAGGGSGSSSSSVSQALQTSAMHRNARKIISSGIKSSGIKRSKIRIPKSKSVISKSHVRSTPIKAPGTGLGKVRRPTPRTA